MIFHYEDQDQKWSVLPVQLELAGGIFRSASMICLYDSPRGLFICA